MFDSFKNAIAKLQDKINAHLNQRFARGKSSTFFFVALTIKTFCVFSHIKKRLQRKYWFKKQFDVLLLLKMTIDLSLVD